MIITILSYDPFGSGDLWYEAKTSLLSHPDIPYEDGVRRIFLYTKGKINDTGDGYGRRLRDMLQYMQHSTAENVSNADIAAIDDIVQRVKANREVSISYMKIWEYERIMKREAREAGLAEGRAAGLEEGRAAGLEEGRTVGLEEGRAAGYAEARREDAISHILFARKYHAPDADILQNLIEDFHFSADSAEELLRTVGLSQWKDAQAESLPYGHQRRLEIARALSLKPKLLLLDEPAAGMNADEEKELVEFIKSIQESFGFSVFLIEHHIDVVSSLCESCVVLDFGKTLASGTPGEVKRDPAVVEAYLGGAD